MIAVKLNLPVGSIVVDRNAVNLTVTIDDGTSKNTFAVQSFALEKFAADLSRMVSEFQSDCDLVSSLFRRK